MRFRRRAGRFAVAVLLVAVPLSLGACGGGDPGAASGGEPTDLGDIVDLTGRAEVRVDVPDNTYAPRAVRVSPGTKVSFVNVGANTHNVTPNEEGPWVPIEMKSGGSSTLTAPTGPGTYRYYCTLHGGRASGQRGALIVSGPTGSAGSPGSSTAP